MAAAGLLLLGATAATPTTLATAALAAGHQVPYIVSMTTQTASSGSRLSSISMDAVTHFELALLEEDADEFVRPAKKSCNERERMKHKVDDIRSIVQEFFGGPSVELSNNINSNSGDMSVLERWFSELDIAWVLHLPDGDVASAKLYHTPATAEASWNCGFRRIMEAIGSTSKLFSVLPDVCEEEDQLLPESDKQANNVPDQIHFARFTKEAMSKRQANNVPDQIHFARFTKEAMSKMLPFVDFAIGQVACINGVWPAPYKKLSTLFSMYVALSYAQGKIRSSFHSLSAEVIEILDETFTLLSGKQVEAGEAIWSTLERIRTLFQDSIDIACCQDPSGSVIPQASSDIHKSTRFVMEYINFLCSDYSNYSSMCQIVSEKFGPDIRKEEHVDRIVMSMKSCLQEKLAKMSEYFPDQGLRFLFLLNNFEFIHQSLMNNHIWYWALCKEGEDLSEKVEGYMENYLQACWEPVFSCLFSPTPPCFSISRSPLLKFESEFNKTYTTQKLWKVPDPKLRKRLRRAITKKIVPRYIEYIEENNIKTLGIRPRDLGKMLQELFEG